MNEDTLVIKQNGAEITDKLNITDLKLYDRYGGMLDNITLQFPAKDTALTFNKFDKLEVKFGYYPSGVMYVDECKRVGEAFVVNAISAKPVNKNKKTKIWNSIGLMNIAADVAGNCGLQLKTYGVKNFIYKCVYQKNETDMEFLKRLCRREGYTIKCENDSLIVFSEYDIEHNYPKMKLTADEVGSWDFKRSINGLNKVTVSCYDSAAGMLIERTATDSNIDGGSKKINEQVSSVDEAARFAAGYLRDANREYVTGYIDMDFRTNISACTVLNLSGFDEFDGQYVVFEVVHDIPAKKTRLNVRQVIDY